MHVQLDIYNFIRVCAYMCASILLNPMKLPICMLKRVSCRQFHMVRPTSLYWIEDTLYNIGFYIKAKSPFTLRILRVLSHSSSLNINNSTFFQDVKPTHGVV